MRTYYSTDMHPPTSLLFLYTYAQGCRHKYWTAALGSDINLFNRQSGNEKGCTVWLRYIELVRELSSLVSYPFTVEHGVVPNVQRIYKSLLLKNVCKLTSLFLKRVCGRVPLEYVHICGISLCPWKKLKSVGTCLDAWN